MLLGILSKQMLHREQVETRGEELLHYKWFPSYYGFDYKCSLEQTQATKVICYNGMHSIPRQNLQILTVPPNSSTWSSNAPLS